MSNYNLGDTVARLNSARSTRLKSININFTKLNLDLCRVLYLNGIYVVFSYYQVF